MVHIGHVNGGEWRLGGEGEKKSRRDILSEGQEVGRSMLSKQFKLLECGAEAVCLEPRLQRGGS